MKKEWTKEKYKIFIDELYSIGDEKYKKFHSGLGINNEYLIGIPVPICKEIAKNISKGDYNTFIKYNTHKTYEERLIHGLILGYIKIDFNLLLTSLKEYIIYIDNWALCDCIIANLHVWKKNTNEGLNFVKWCLKQENEWYRRVGYVILLDYYINEEYLNIIFKLCNDNKMDKYYVKMAIAWLISICYVKYPKETLEYIKNNKLDNWTHNKAIQKIRESKRVSKIDKEMLLEWKKG